MSVLLSLVVGLASAATMFAIVHAVLLAPLPYPNPDRLVSLTLESNTGRESGALRLAQPPALFDTYQQHSKHLSQLGYYRIGHANIGADTSKTDTGIADTGIADTGGAVTERVTATWVTPSVFPLLGITPLRGRPFSPEESRQGETGAVVLSEGIWRTQFGAREDILGQTLIVNNIPRVVIAIMPARFTFPTSETRIWLPVRTSATSTVGDFSYTGIARLADQATVAETGIELSGILPGLATAFPRMESGSATATWLQDTRPDVRVEPLLGHLTGPVAPILWLLGTTGALVLLVAWANATNLMLMRADARQLEWSVRGVLGAGTWHRGAFFLGESFWLSAVSAVVALAIVAVALEILVGSTSITLPRLAELHVNAPTVGFILLTALSGWLLMTMLPMYRLRQKNLAVALRDGARNHSSGRAPQRLRTLLVITQIGFAWTALIGATLLLKTTRQLNDVDPGFRSDGVTVVWTLLPYARFNDAEAVLFHERLAEQTRQLPFVESAGLTQQVPLAGQQTTAGQLTTAGAETSIQRFRIDRSGQVVSLASSAVDGGYFRTLGIPLIAGRMLRERMPPESGSNETHSVLINRSAASLLFGDPEGHSAIGQPLPVFPDGPRYTIVGVVGDVRDVSLAAPQVPMVYRHHQVPINATAEPGTRRLMALVVRSKRTADQSASADLVIPAIRHLVRELDPTIPIFNVGTLDQIVRTSQARQLLVFGGLTLAAVITLILSAIGLYGVMAYMVALRSREFALRMALGAPSTRILRLVAEHGLVITFAGITFGSALHVLATPILRQFLFNVTPMDPQVLGSAGGLLLLIATVAIGLPAMIAARVDPARAIHAE